MTIPGQDLSLGGALLLVTAQMAPEHEVELNRWFDEEHVPERLECPGFLWARRYRRTNGGPAYVHLYGLEDTAVLDTPEYRRVVPPTNRRRAFPDDCIRTSVDVYRNVTAPLPPGYRVDAAR